MNKMLKVFFLGCAVLILLGTFIDYQVTDALSGHFLPLARVTEVFGEIPYALCLSVAFAILFRFSKTKSKSRYLIFTVISGCLGVLFSWMLFYGMFKYFNPTGGNSHGTVSSLMTVLSVLLGLILYIFLVSIMYKIPETNKVSWILVAKKMFLLSFSTLLFTNIIKMIVGRPRYWILDTLGSDFVPWFQINGFTTINANMSFVSGHTANAFVMIGFAFLFTKGSKNYNRLILLSLIWGSLVGAGRLFSGQHFLTDVTFGAVLTLMLFTVIDKLFDKKDILTPFT